MFTGARAADVAHDGGGRTGEMRAKETCRHQPGCTGAFFSLKIWICVGPPRSAALRQLTPAAPITQGQLGRDSCVLATPWNAGNAGLRVEDHLSLVISFLPSHMYTNPPGLEPLWKDVSRHLCSALFPVTLLTLPPVRTTVFVTAGRGLRGRQSLPLFL